MKNSTKNSDFAIAEREEKFRNFFEYSVVGKSITSLDGKVRANKAFCNIVGYTEEEMTNINWQDFTHPDDVEPSVNATKRLLTGESVSEHWEKRYIHKNGNIVWVDIMLSLNKHENGTPQYFITEIIDITERKRIEEGTLNNQQLLNTLLRLSSDLIDINKEEKDYQDLLQPILEISGAKYASFNLYESDNLDFRTVALCGLSNIYSKASKILGYDLSAKVWKFDPVRDKKIRNKTITRFENLFELNGAVIPLSISNLVSKTFDIEKAYVVNISKNDNWLGDFTLYFSRGASLLNSEIVEIYAYQVAVFLERKHAKAELITSEQKYRNLVENSPDAIAIYTQKELVYVNHECLTVMGAKSEDELLGKNVIDFVHPDNLDFVRERMKNALVDGKILPLAEEKFMKLDGTPFDVEVKAIPIVYSNEKAVQIIVRDISERKQAEASLKHERELYFDLVNVQPAGIYRLRVFSSDKWVEDAWSNSANSPYIVEFASDRFCEILGVSRTEFENNPKVVGDLIHPDDQVEYEIRNKEANIKQIPFSWDCRLIIKGEVKWLHFESLPRKLENGDIIFTGILYDIGERKIAEQALRENEQKFRILFAENPQPMLIYDLETLGFLEVNQTALDYYGYTREEFLKMTTVDLHPADEIPKFLQRIQQTKEGKPTDGISKHVKKNGEIIYVEISTVPAPTIGKNARYIMVLDVTQRKLAEDALRKNEQFLMETQKVAELGSYSWDITTGMWTSSEILDEIFGIDENYVRSLDGWLALIHPDWQDSMTNYVTDDVLGKRLKFDKEYKIVRQNTGEACWVHGLGRLEVDENNEPKMLIGTISNIDSRKKAEETILTYNSLLDATIESTADGILVIDNERNITIFNRKFAQMWNIPADMLNIESDEKLLSYVVNQLKAPQTFLDKIEELYMQPDMNSKDIFELIDGRTFKRFSIPQKVGDKVVGRVWSFRNITERIANQKKLEEKVIEMTRFQNLTVGRELTMIELKKEINELLKNAGEEQKYVIVE